MIVRFKNHEPKIHSTSYIYPTAQIIGHVELKEQSSVWPGVVLRGDIEPITIGARSNVQDNSVAHTSEKFPVKLGSDVSVGHSVTLHGCTVGDRCIIGMGSTLLDGCVVEDDCLIGAGALVAPGARIPKGSLALGVPARVIRRLSEEELEHIRKNAAEYVMLKEHYRAS